MNSINMLNSLYMAGLSMHKRTGMDFTENVHTLFNNDIDNSAGLGAGDDMHYIDFNEGKLIDAGGVTARCVRLYSNGSIANEFNHYVEVEVWARPPSN